MSQQFFQKVFQSTVRRFVTTTKSEVFWTFPLLVGGGWLLWPAIDLEYKVELGLAADPDAGLNAVEAARQRRMDLVLATKPNSNGGPADDDEDDEEEEGGGGDGDDGDEEEEGGSGGDGEEDEEEEDEQKIEIKPLYLPTKGKKLNKYEIWDNFTIKAVKMTDEDDDEEGDEDDGT